MTHARDLIIVGGGVMGLLSAFELAQRGVQVTLLERGELMSEASWAGGGIISPLYPWRYSDSVTALASRSQQRYPELMEMLKELSGIDPQFTRHGMLMAASADDSSALSWAAREGVALEPVTLNHLCSLQPGLSAEGTDWLWMPHIASVRNPRLGQALIGSLQKMGNVTLLPNNPVVRFLTAKKRIEGVETATGALFAKAVLVCAGAWSRSLCQSFSHTLAVEPVKGEMLLFRGPPGLLKRVVLREGRYLIPRADGRIVAGSTLEHARFDKRPTQAGYHSLYQSALGLFPALKGIPLEAHWGGLRPGSPSGIPYIGRVPGVENLWLNTGQFRNGLVLAPASCELVANLICAEPPCVDPAPYHLQATRAAHLI